jgi:Flp pilus assembly protein TadG
MLVPQNALRRRGGVTTVETAMVMLPLMLTMFSIFEYGRFVMVRQLLDLSAEIACRYAIANNTSATILTDVQTQVNQSMAGLNSTTHFSSPLTTGVYAVPTSLWTPTITSTGSTTWTVIPPSNATMVSSSPSDLASINGIQPGFPIAVRVSGNFKMMFPTLLYVSPTVPMNSMVILTCEGT